MTQVTAIDAYWLGEVFFSLYDSPITHYHVAELGSVFYSVREKNFDDGSSRRRADREFSKRAELENQIKKQREECVSIPWIGSGTR